MPRPTLIPILLSCSKGHFDIQFSPTPFSRSSFPRTFSDFSLEVGWCIQLLGSDGAGGEFCLLNLVTMNRPRAAAHMEGSWQPPMGMWKNSRKLCFPRRAIKVVSRQFPCPGGSLETSSSNWRTGFLARVLFTCSLRIRRSGTRSSPMGLTINIFPEGCI